MTKKKMFADDWIRTTELWSWEWPLYQLSPTTAKLALILVKPIF